MKTIIENIKETQSDIILWTGDLNFRKLPTDQLDNLLKTDEIIINNKKFLETNRNFNETCRMIECVQLEKCKRNYDNKRIPSFCDRILYTTSNKYTITPIDYKSDDSGEIKYSDHNLVYFTGILTTVPNSEKSSKSQIHGGFYENYINNKNNYLQLKNKNLKI